MTHYACFGWKRANPGPPIDAMHFDESCYYWNFIMADYNFVLNKIFKFALHRVPISWPRLSALDLSVWYYPPRASLPRLPQAGCTVGNQENNSVNLMPAIARLLGGVVVRPCIP
jgi:hypothetical protein